MVLQQFGGVNGIAFYASSIFISAGMLRIFSCSETIEELYRKFILDKIFIFNSL